MLNLTIKNIFHKKTRSILTIAGIVIAMQLYIVLSGIMNIYDSDMQKQVASMAGKVFVQAKTEGRTSMLPMQNVISEDEAKTILNIDNIDKSLSTMILYNEVIPATTPNMPPAVFVAALEPGKEKAYFNNIEVTGSNTINNTNEVILGATAALWAKQEYNAKLNDTITLRAEQFKIVGILPATNITIDSSIVMPIEKAQQLYSKPNLVNAIMITAEKADETEQLAQAITEQNNNVIASTPKEMQKAADEMLAGQRMFFAMINNTIVFVAIFMVMIVMVMAIHERKKEIGTLKAIGASFKTIVFMVISESTILGILGGLIALPVSLIFTWLIVNGDLETVLLYNNPTEWPAVFIVTILIGLLAGIIPAFSARKVNPLESIRYE